jgi:hypothetical protein
MGGYYQSMASEPNRPRRPDLIGELLAFVGNVGFMMGLVVLLVIVSAIAAGLSRDDLAWRTSVLVLLLATAVGVWVSSRHS